MVVFTSRQIEKTKLFRKFYINVGLPTEKNFKHMLSINIISKCPISVSDISNAENVYSPLVASLKGKSTRSKTKARNK